MGSLLNILAKAALILGFILSSGVRIHAQTYNFHYYSPDNGFPQANADHIIQDHLGYIWVATQVGAVRFDGKQYKVFNTKNGLPTHIVTSFLESHDKKIWIATRNGLSCYNYDTITSYSEADGLPNKHITHIWEDNQRRLWVMTSNGLCYKSDNKFVPHSLPDGYTKINKHVIINDSIYLATNKGILIQEEFHLRKTHKTLNNKDVVDFTIDKNNTLWAAIENEGLLCIKDDKIVEMSENRILQTNAVSEIHKSRNGIVWIGTEGNGIFSIENGVFKHYGTRNGMTNTSVLDIFEDDENNIWIGGRNGIIVFNPGNPFIHYPEANNHSKQSVFGMLHDSFENYWFTTYGNGISKFDGSQWEYFDQSNGLPDNRVFSMIETGRNNFWLSTAGKGIVHFDGNKFTQPANTPQTRTFAVIADHLQNLWMCTQTEGIVKYDGTKFHYFNKNNELTTNAFMSGFLDSKTRLWFGSIGDGAYLYENNQFTKVKLNTDTTPPYIRAISEDKHGNIWFGTASKGVCQLIPAINNTFDCYFIDTKKGLESNNVYFITFDPSNQMWIGTEKGVDKVILNKAQQAESIHHYGKEEGFLGVETSINGVMTDKHGNLWMGTNMGVTIYNSLQEKRNKKQPRTYITDIKLFYKNTNWRSYTKRFDHHGMPQNLRLPYNHNHLSFAFIGLSYTNPQKVKYRYKLEGLESDWSPETKLREAIYTNIPPGSYTFKVIACNNNDIWNENATEYTFTITPPFWKTPWFFAIAIMLGILAILLYIKLKTQALKNTQRILTRKVQERTQEIELQKNEIQEKNEELNQRNEEIAAQRDELDKQNKMLEHLYKDQTNSIKHARYIQTAVMPKTTILDSFFAEYFILLKPQGIVSGDFYFVANHQNHIILAAIDSTGHGVPGGFMSMLGISFLNEIIYTMQEISVDIILENLRSKIIHSLQQKGVPGEQKEGMELAIIAIDKTTKICQYAGARNELTILRRENKTIVNTEIIDKNNHFIQYLFAPDRMPVSIYPKMKPFSKQTFQLYDNDQLYLYTDGYADQLNVSQNKKISHAKLRKLILKNGHLNLPEQKSELDKFINSWQGNTEQIDDILVIGIKI